MKTLRKPLKNSAGFTLVELGVAMVVFAMVGVAIYGIMIHTSQAGRMGSTITEAQQNARAALDTILRDLREMGYGLGPLSRVPVETASEYRVTFVLDQNEDGIIGPGERVTYFLDKDNTDPLVVDTPNPDDYVLRRVISTPTDLAAAPGSGKGQVVAYCVTQRTPGNAGWNVPLFTYFNGSGASLMGGDPDPDDSAFGSTVPDSSLGQPSGSGLSNLVQTVRVEVVAEATHQDPETHDFKQVRVTGTIHPRNFGLAGRDFFSNYNPSTGTGSGSPSDSTGSPSDSTGSPSDSTVVPELPPEEPPIRIPTERVLSLVLADLHEVDSDEGSNVTVDHQHDWDIVLGTQAGGTNNLAVWFEGIPDRYSDDRLYNAAPNYTGYSSQDINQIATGNIDQSAEEYVDVVAASAISDYSGGFGIWLNQNFVGKEGYLGAGLPTTVANGYYSNLSGAGLSAVLVDLDYDLDLDVVLGTRTGTNTGKIELWANNGFGAFTFMRAYDAAGEVNALVAADFDDDGVVDIAAGTKTHNNGNQGKIEIWINKLKTAAPFDMQRVRVYDSGGQVKSMVSGYMNADDVPDLVVGTQTGRNNGTVELWLNDGSGDFSLGDQAVADNVVLSVAVGQLDYGNTSADIAAGTADRSVQVWFCDPEADPADIMPPTESWADANTGGLVNAIAIQKVEASKDRPEDDLLNDIVVGTAISPTSGEIVIYLNPYVWAITTPLP